VRRGWILSSFQRLIANSIDTVGVHYSGTLWRWYRNWVGNVEAIKAKYGPRWYRVRIPYSFVE
jgi:hypothetical protein